LVAFCQLCFIRKWWWCEFVNSYTLCAMRWTDVKKTTASSQRLTFSLLTLHVMVFFYHCRLFFRRHCNLYCVTYCGLDTRGRRWVTASIKCYIIACLFRSSQLVIVSGQRFFLCHGRWMSSVLTQNVVLSSPNFFYGDGGPEVDNFLNLIISSLSSQFKLMGLRDNVRSSWAH